MRAASAAVRVGLRAGRAGSGRSAGSRAGGGQARAGLRATGQSFQTGFRVDLATRRASESIRKAYDQKCNQLRHQFAKGMSPQVIDKTRATVKDLHSRVRVMIKAVDSISRRIEKLRDEELQPQLAELVQGYCSAFC
ncbi:hypothetical protein IEQ34_011284 [Dendrobium chrysotoxum]|uniref:DUF632 domain-containing protein n=1 Tax=Dendrobium chrysotoxum TaxID=161865 RepID=A0AAV7GV53_DENCH|nr:hypothetical protein IEQ34_011284 [Dendrobium chrysotoxum]